MSQDTREVNRAASSEANRQAGREAVAAPSLWDVMAADPAIGVDPAVLALVIDDQRSASRALLYPWARVLARAAVTLIVAARRACPVPLSAHGVMDRMCVWFCRRLVSPAAVTLLIRHFIVEANLLAFIARNAGVPEPALRPVSLSELGNRAVIEHDLNVYRVLLAVGRAGLPAQPPACPPGPPPGSGPGRAGGLDFSMLDVPAIDSEPAARRLLRLDIQTALCLMSIPFAACLTSAQYRRAVHSMRLDSSLLAVLASLTGDAAFLRWTPGPPPVRVDSSAELPSMVYDHAVICEAAHARLCRLRDERAEGASWSR
jgi:hypothetical protein